ncbi:hypothetical protein MAR_017835, partial [Mya arenaria]
YTWTLGGYSVLEYQAKYDSVLRTQLDNSDPRIKNTSPEIQNEMITLSRDRIRRPPFFGLFEDETKEMSSEKKMALCLRHFDRTTKSNLRQADNLNLNSAAAKAGTSRAAIIQFGFIIGLVVVELCRAGADISDFKKQNCNQTLGNKQLLCITLIMDGGILQKISQELCPTVTDIPCNQEDSSDVPKRDNSRAPQNDLLAIKKGQQEQIALMQEMMQNFAHLKSDVDRLRKQM